MATTGPRIRVIDASLGSAAQVRVVIDGVSDLDSLQRAWASSGAHLVRDGDRIEATTTAQALARAAGRTLPDGEGAAVDAALHAALRAWAAPAPPWVHRRGALPCNERPILVGIVNVTPDSFTDGGVLYPGDHPDAAINHGRALIAEGADVLDVGGESTRPGAEPVEADEELARVIPVVTALAGDGHVVSIDTTKAEVAAEALAAGAAIVNDVSAAADPALLEHAARSGSGYVLMHSRGTPADMQDRTDYTDVTADVFAALVEGLQRCADAGLPPARVAVDPGIGFAKTGDQNLELLGRLRELRSLGHPVMIGASRKSFIARLLDEDTPEGRLEGSIAAATAAVLAGAAILRVHDVAATRRAVTVANAVSRSGR